MTRQIKIALACAALLIVLLFLFTDVLNHQRFTNTSSEAELTYHEHRLAESGKGYQTGQSSTGQNNTFIGYNAGQRR